MTGLPFLVPSLGPSLMLAAVSPGREDATPAAIVIGHGAGLLAALAALLLCGLVGEPSALESRVTLARVVAVSLALGLTLATMLVVGRLHAPAGATTLLVALGVLRAGSDTVVLGIAVVYTALLVAAFPRVAAHLDASAPTASRRRPRPTRRARSRQAT